MLKISNSSVAIFKTTKMLGVILITLYILLWSYFYLAIEYSEYKHRVIFRLVSQCPETAEKYPYDKKQEIYDNCIKGINNSIVTAHGIFKPLLK